MYQWKVPPFKMADDRFAIVAGDDLEALLEGIDASNTKRCTATAVNTLREYLSAKKYRDFENFTYSQLDVRSPNFT